MPHGAEVSNSFEVLPYGRLLLCQVTKFWDSYAAVDTQNTAFYIITLIALSWHSPSLSGSIIKRLLILESTTVTCAQCLLLANYWTVLDGGRREEYIV